MAANMETGKKGEDIAAQYLQQNGYQILEKNWRYHRNEIDIVASINNVVVVAEVKTRHSKPLVAPELAVDRTKRKAIIRSANAYVNYKRMLQEVRFDIITVIISGENAEVNHIIDAFYPTLR